MVKPLAFENVIEMAKMLKTYWLRMDQAPEASRVAKESLRRGPGR